MGGAGDLTSVSRHDRKRASLLSLAETKYRPGCLEVLEFPEYFNNSVPGVVTGIDLLRRLNRGISGNLVCSHLSKCHLPCSVFL